VALTPVEALGDSVLVAEGVIEDVLLADMEAEGELLMDGEPLNDIVRVTVDVCVAVSECEDPMDAVELIVDVAE
jgi:hypothetical protein